MALLLGLDIGSSSIKASILDSITGETIASAQSPQQELAMVAVQPGWAEQDPDIWFEHVLLAIRQCLANPKVNAQQIRAIGIAYQMHGLVVLDKHGKPLRPSIIWCDSRAVGIGDKVFRQLGSEYCLNHLLNSPGNFTASKLRWVKENEPNIYQSVAKAVLPGDYIAFKLTGSLSTTATGLSEGILWDFKNDQVAAPLLEQFEISAELLADRVPVFSNQGTLLPEISDALGLPRDVIVAYRAGDQPNNAFSLGALRNGEVAATAGTSGVIYAVTNRVTRDAASRVNTFLHVNHEHHHPSYGVLLCINGTGIGNSWLKKVTNSGQERTYEAMNEAAAALPPCSDDLFVLPFGNGSERILNNKTPGAAFLGIDFNRHSQAHLFRAIQEGIVFSMRYGFDIIREMGIEVNVIRAGMANMFLSPVFRQAFVNTLHTPLELYDTDGASGAARGAGVGAGIFPGEKEAFLGLKRKHLEVPDNNLASIYQEGYVRWKHLLEQQL